MRAEQMINEYKSMKKELGILEFQLSQFKGLTEDDIILSMQLSHPDGDERVQTSILSDKTAKVAMNYRQIMERENDEWYKFLWERYKKMTEEVTFFESSVKKLSGVFPELIMDLLDDDITWDEMMVKYHISRTTISKYRKKAILELNEQYEIRDRQIESFILS
jgi:aconitase A